MSQVSLPTATDCRLACLSHHFTILDSLCLAFLVGQIQIFLHCVASSNVQTLLLHCAAYRTLVNSTLSSWTYLQHICSIVTSVIQESD